MSNMSSAVAIENPTPAGPTPWGRVALTFTSPSRAFSGLGFSSSWWAPYIVLVVFSLAMMFTIGKTVGWETVARNNIASSPGQQAKFTQVPAKQQDAQMAMVGRIIRVSSYVTPIIVPFVLGAILAGLLLATFNFGMGAHAGFGSLFSVYVFSSLPQVIKAVLVILLLALGTGRDTFLLNNPMGSNPAFYMPGSPHWLVALLTWFDVFLIWQIVLLIIGCAIVARVTRGRAAAAVIGWTVLFMLITTATAAA